MITFTLALVLLIGGYFTYGRYVNRIFAPNPTRRTPAVTMTDGVDYMPLPTWRVFMIQFLNIAGLGPIFGAIMGAQFGTASYLWIVFGTIFAGGVHDFLCATLSLRHNGVSLPQLAGEYLGATTRKVMCVFSILLLLLLAAVFVSGPAELLATMTAGSLNTYFWVVVIFLYYILATTLPIDKIIARFYPLFGFALLFMAVGIMAVLFIRQPDLPEMWNGFGTKYDASPLFPMMFISIACGAISGFHSTQSPLMARCITNEKYCRPVFYGAMVTEGIVALIWAAAATCFFHDNGTIDPSTGIAYSGARIASDISKEWLGAFGSILAILGIVAAPVTSGDTALRSARLIIADTLHLSQRTIRNRMYISLPIFILTAIFLIYSLKDAEGFKIIWRYFSWSNQTLAVFTLWTITVWLVRTRKNYWVSLIPALFMTAVTFTYILVAPEGFHFSGTMIPTFVIISEAVAITWFVVWFRRRGQFLDEKNLR